MWGDRDDHGGDSNHEEDNDDGLVLEDNDDASGSESGEEDDNDLALEANDVPAKASPGQSVGELKEEGNRAFREGRPYDARELYGAALAASSASLAALRSSSSSSALSSLPSATAAVAMEERR